MKFLEKQEEYLIKEKNPSCTAVVLVNSVAKLTLLIIHAVWL